jgi:hypothetical protein
MWISRTFVGLAFVLLAVGAFYGIAPGHRYHSALIREDGRIDRDRFDGSHPLLLDRSLDELELGIVSYERHRVATWYTDMFMFGSWCCLLVAYVCRARRQKAGQVRSCCD